MNLCAGGCQKMIRVLRLGPKKKHMFFAELPVADPNSEQAWLTSKHRFLRFSRLVVKDAPKEGEARTCESDTYPLR